MDPLSSKSRAALKTPQSFLGENSGLVNLDQLIQAPVPTAQPAAYNPFGDIQQPSKTNLFQQQMQPVSIRRRYIPSNRSLVPNQIDQSFIDYKLRFVWLIRCRPSIN